MKHSKLYLAMRLGLTTSLVSVGMIGIPSSVSAEEALDIIQVESTTIDDRFDAKREEPSNIAIISGEKVDKQHTQNIQQVLQSIPGITTELQSGDSLKIHIRGVENQRYMGEKPGVAVVIDGVPVFERTGRVNIDLDNIESIKVIKGGASYLFGDDALSGAVIITTKRGAKYAGYTAGVEAGSFGYRKYLGRAGFANENGSGHIQVSQREGDGYYADSDFKSEYLNGKLQYYLDDVSDITFGMEISDRNKDSHGTVDGITSAELDPKSAWIENDDYARMYDVHLEKFFATYSRDFSDTDNLLVNAYQFSDDTNFVSRPINGYYYLDGTQITDPDAYAYGNDYFQVQRGIKAEYRSAGEQLAWMGGLDLRANTYENNVEFINSYKYSRFTSRPAGVAGDVISDNETEENIQAVYGEAKFRVTDPLTMTLNGRYDHIALDYLDDIEDLNLDKSFNVWSWRVGGNYELNPSTDIYGNISTGFRAPSVTQLFAGDMDPDGGTASNPELEPEEARNFEIGLRRKFPMLGVNWDLDAALFRIDRKDYIMSTAGQYALTQDDELLRYENIGGMRSRGLELSLRSDTSRKFWVNVGYSYLDAFFTDYDNYNLLLGNRYGRNPSLDALADGDQDGICEAADGFDPTSQYCVEHYDLTGNQIPRSPKHHLNIGLNWKATPHWILTGEIDAKSSYYADELNWNKVSGHTVFNLLASYDRKFGNNNTFSFFARVDNVFDKEYWNTARGSYDGASPGTGGEPDGVFDMEDISIVVNQGRTFTAGINVTF